MAARFPEQQQPTDTLEYHINTFFNRIMMCVDARRVAVLREAENTRNEEIDRQRQRVDGHQQLEDTKEEIEDCMRENTLHELREGMLRQLDLKQEEVRTPLPETRVVFQGDYGDLEQLIATLGEIRKEQVQPVLREIREEPIPVVVPLYEDMRPVVSAGKKGKALGELWSPNAVAIDSNTNYIYVAEGHAFEKFPRISIFSERGEFINSCTLKRMKCPEGIAIHGDSMYVTDVRVHSVFLFKIESHIQYVAKKGSEGAENDQFKAPANLAVSPNGNVYVADTKNNRIQVLDPSLNFIQTLAEQLIEQPRDIKLTADSVYVLCSVSPCIRVFSYSGVKLRSLITLGYQQPVIDACYFCLDSQENIVISDNGAHSLKVFNREGTMIHSIEGSQSDEEMFYNPRGLALNNKSNLVLVSNNRNNCLVILTS